jgi:RNA polymerase sigma-70 factor, ECF subfamily
MTGEDIDRLVTKAQRGDAQAFGELYEYFVEQIYKYVLLKVSSRIEAQDITSDVFGKAWDSLENYKQDNFRAYLYKIANNTVIDHYRKYKNKSVQVDDTNNIADEKTDLVENIYKKEQAGKVRQAISKLPKNYADVIRLRFFEDLPIKKTAEKLGKSSVSVRVTQHRALAKLRFVLVSILIIAIFITYTGVSFAQNSLPGESLYPIKRLIENVQLALTPTEKAQVRLRKDLTTRRIEELKEIKLTDKVESINQALDEVDKSVERVLKFIPEKEKDVYIKDVQSRTDKLNGRPTPTPTPTTIPTAIQPEPSPSPTSTYKPNNEVETTKEPTTSKLKKTDETPAENRNRKTDF